MNKLYIILLPILLLTFCAFNRVAINPKYAKDKINISSAALALIQMDIPIEEDMIKIFYKSMQPILMLQCPIFNYWNININNELLRDTIIKQYEINRLLIPKTRLVLAPYIPDIIILIEDFNMDERVSYSSYMPGSISIERCLHCEAKYAIWNNKDLDIICSGKAVIEYEYRIKPTNDDINNAIDSLCSEIVINSPLVKKEY